MRIPSQRVHLRTAPIGAHTDAKSLRLCSSRMLELVRSLYQERRFPEEDLRQHCHPERGPSHSQSWRLYSRGSEAVSLDSESGAKHWPMAKVWSGLRPRRRARWRRARPGSRALHPAGGGRLTGKRSIGISLDRHRPRNLPVIGLAEAAVSNPPVRSKASAALKVSPVFNARVRMRRAS